MSRDPGHDDAVIVLNVLSDDATVLRVGAGGLESRTIRGVAHGANALAVSSDGGWAIAWTDARRIKNADPERGLPGPHRHQPGPAAAKPKTIVSAGFRPVSVAFAADGSQAFAVTEDGITVVDLGGAAGPRVSKNVIITDDPTENADTRDVSLTPSGGLAVIRREGSAAIGIVDLATSARAIRHAVGAGHRSRPDQRRQARGGGRPRHGRGRDPAARRRRPSRTARSPASPSRARSSARSRSRRTAATALLYSNATTLERLTVLTLGPTPSYPRHQAARARAVRVRSRGRRERRRRPRRRHAARLDDGRRTAAPPATAGPPPTPGRRRRPDRARARVQPGPAGATCPPRSRRPKRRPTRWCCRRTASAR